MLQNTFASHNTVLPLVRKLPLTACLNEPTQKRQSNMVKRILITVALFTLMHQSACAESVWCRNLGLGCPTEADRAKAMQNCQILANEMYEEALKAALLDPRLWMFGGYSSAQDYAAGSKLLMLTRCIKSTVN